MCNPRRVRVRATRELAHAWEQEIRRRVTRTGEAQGEARIREPLGESVGAPALAALPAVLARTPGWEQDEDGLFRHDLHGGSVVYDPATRELEISARVTATVTASGEAATSVRAEVHDTVEAEGEGMYYDDNWGGRTEEDATRDAHEDLERAFAAARGRRMDEERRRAEDREGEALDQQAAARADRAYAAAADARTAELRAAAEDSLFAVGVEGRNLFHRALAEAYRDALLAYARQRGAERLNVSETDGVLEIEFDLRV
ncbi:molecular chaperone DnaJ [Streptomyces spongiae]|uniref:Molecular chaperone DnaJ n=1 Tax=Streptomyces spongiae TaxID=565072 RepID=A0A5N8XFX8_9ACTN|nr:molecular chaperone DnaJ [Streptomyces spongiae]MPY58423.1 molecular chaperone DnaJ [Streptomyces spongiae]